MKTPDEIKGWLGERSRFPHETLKRRACLGYIQQLESTVGQVSKALCGNKNATPDELLQAVSQLKYRLAQAERERATALHDMNQLQGAACDYCKNMYRPNGADHCVCREFGDLSTIAGSNKYALLVCAKFEWRGVCEENTKEE